MSEESYSATSKTNKKGYKQPIRGLTSFGMKIAEELEIFAPYADITKYLRTLVKDPELTPHIKKSFKRWIIKDADLCSIYLRKKLSEKFYELCKSTCPESTDKLYTLENIKRLGGWDKELYDKVVTDDKLISILKEPVLRKENGMPVFGYPQPLVTTFIEAVTRKYSEANLEELLEQDQRSIQSIIGSSFEKTAQQMKEAEAYLYSDTNDEPFED